MTASLARRLFGLALPLALAVGLGAATSPGCKKTSNHCEPYDGGLPNVDAGEACAFPCPVAERGGDAGGDTYANFASGFFTTYCVRCHSTTRDENCHIPGDPDCRYGAPPGYNWDDPASIRRHLSKIRRAVGVGDPISMPPDLPVTPNPLMPAPTCEDRFRLTRFIDVGAPGL